jgi:hypothetical protein
MASIEDLQEEGYNKEFFEAEEKTMLQKLADEPDRLHGNHKYLSIIYGFMHRHEECVFHAEKAIALAKNRFERADTRILIARSHVYRKEINLAIGQYLIAQKEDPEHKIVLEELILLLQS